MSMQLSSIRLCSIGERSARFNDLTLDLTAPHLDEQTASVTLSPADSVIWLRNGGGKSSLLSLFYALILPHAHDFMGRAVKRSLTDYVDNGDTSHTIAQWRSTGSGELAGVGERTLVTGAIYEWSDLRRPSTPERARDQLGVSYYCFYASAMLDATTLPLRDSDGIPLRRAAVVAAIRERIGDDQGSDLFVARSQSDWSAGLHARGLDPEMFRPQKQMNHVEGGVEDLFKFAAPSDFIDFLLDLTVAPDRADDIAGVLATISDVLALKPAKTAERDFCRAVVLELDALARAHEESSVATTQLDDAIRDAGRLGATMRASVAAAEKELLGLSQEEHDLAEDGSSAEDRARSASELAHYGRGVLARVRAKTAEDRSLNADEEVARHREIAAAWALTRPLAEQRELVDRLDQLNEPEGREGAETAASLIRREHAGARYRGRLLALAESSAVQAETSLVEMRALVVAEEELRLAAQSLDEDRLAAEQAVATAQAELDRVDHELARAEQMGDLTDSGADVQGAFDAAQRDAAAHDEELAQTRARRALRPARRRELAEKSALLLGEESAHSSESATILRELSASEDARQAIAGSRRFLELAESTPEAPGDVLSDGVAVAIRLREEIAAADSALIRLEAARIDERRVLDVFSRSGFLPSTAESEELVEVLRLAGVDASSGWEALRSRIPDARLTRALQDHRLAALGTGIVIADGQRAAMAKALSAVRMVTTANIGVYSRSQVDEVLTEAATSGELVPLWLRPNPGLVLGPAANDAVGELRQRSVRLDDERRSLSESRVADRDLADRLDAYLQSYPASRTDALAERHELLTSARVRLGEEVTAIRVELDRLDADDDTDAAAEESHIEASARLGAKANRMGHLLAVVAQAVDWQATLVDGRETVACAREGVATIRAQVTATRVQGADARSASESELRWAQELRREAESIRPTGEDVLVDDDPAATLDMLRDRFQAAEQDYRQESTVSVRAERLQGIRDQLAKVNEEFAGVAPALIEKANAHLFSAPGQRRASRIAETERAQHEVEQAIARAAQEVAAWSSARIEADVFAGVTVPGGVQGPPEAGDQQDVGDWIKAQEGVAAQAESEIARLARRAQGLELRRQEARSKVRHFQLLASDLPTDEGTAPVPFDGDDDEAVAARDAATTAVRSARTRASDTGATAAGIVDRLRQCAARSSAVRTPARERIAHDAPEVLAASATMLAGQLGLRAEIIDEELRGIVKDQQIVTDSLARLVSEALATLRDAERYSTLPDTVPAWAGKKMLTIRFEAPSDHLELRAIMDRAIDERVAAGVRVEGLPLLKEAVHAAAGPRGFTVKVLKPAVDLVATHEDITLLGKWSGGEKLTVCVALYCTLAALRAANAGQAERSGGVLLLDNPIGRASHGSLVALQREVAAAHGVQLVYTTGVKDPDAVSRFPNVVRLDNRAGRTRNRRYIVADADSDAGHGEAEAHIRESGPFEQVVAARVARW